MPEPAPDADAGRVATRRGLPDRREALVGPQSHRLAVARADSGLAEAEEVSGVALAVGGVEERRGVVADQVALRVGRARAIADDGLGLK